MDESNLLWKILSGVTTLLIFILGWVWKGQVETAKDHEERIAYLEKHWIRREEFNNAMTALRAEFKEEQRALTEEMRDCRDTLLKQMSAGSEELTKRLDNFITLWARENNRRKDI